MQRLARKWRYSFSQNIQNKLFTLSSKIGGSSKDGLYERYANKYHNRAIEDFKRQLLANNDSNEGPRNGFYIPGATIITSVEECKKCVEILMKTKTIAAWDSETMDLDIKNEAPVGKGKIICASFFAGPQYNFGNGPRVFIDNFGQNAGLIMEFKEYLESEAHKKVWHNYGFDRHLFGNHGINVRGFGGDTMHMARLYDSSKMFGHYSLSALTQEYADKISKVTEAYIQNIKQETGKSLQAETDPAQVAQLNGRIGNLDSYLEGFKKSLRLKKTKMEELFRRRKILKSGGQGVSYEYPTTLTLHTSIEYIKNWVEYSLRDSETTFYLRETLQKQLLSQKSKQFKGIDNMWTLYQKYWLGFGELLTDMERVGIKIDFEHMQTIEQQAQDKLNLKRAEFIQLLKHFQRDPNIDLFNPSSCLQLQQLIHAPYKVMPMNKEESKEFDDEQRFLIESAEQGIVENKKKETVRKPTTFDDEVKIFKIENKDPKRGKNKIEMKVTGMGIPALKTTPLGLPSVDESVLDILAGNPKEGKFGKAYDHFFKQGKEEDGKTFCEMLSVLSEYRSLETLVQTFILPLRSYADANERIHCSLNINTETGRLSARKPNLQNQPALQKDIYKLRKAFICEKGNKLIVADYGQLELRVLAHLTNCKAMLTAFKAGGDFHSRTAISMYDYIKQDVLNGAVLLEWDKSKGKPPVPLLKEKYASERKQAKTVNFSIAYGKSARGFAQDWNCSLQEANKVIDAWFAERKEVKDWQNTKQKNAEQRMCTQTLLGRYRNLAKFFLSEKDSKDLKKGRMLKGMRDRRAINTPIQGGAADIVIAAMVNISRNEQLRTLGWKLLLQIHDQLILQGPEETANQAFVIVKHEMEHPFEEDLRVALEVDAKIVPNWMQGK